MDQKLAERTNRTKPRHANLSSHLRLTFFSGASGVAKIAVLLDREGFLMGFMDSANTLALNVDKTFDGSFELSSPPHRSARLCLCRACMIVAGAAIPKLPWRCRMRRARDAPHARGWEAAYLDAAPQRS